MSDENNNDSNDFADDQIDFGSDGIEDEFESGGNSFGDMWRNNPLVKFGVIAGAVLAVIGALILFGGGDDQARRAYSRVAPAQDVSQVPGTGEVSEVYREAVEEQNVQRREQAIREGGSAIPTPIDAPVTRLSLPEQETAQEDPLERWRRIQEERQRQQARVSAEARPTVDPSVEAINELANAMASQMSSILSARSEIPSMQHQNVTSRDYMQQRREEEQNRLAAQQQQIQQQQQMEQAPETVDVIVPAGTIEYAQLIIEANSDSPSPILAQIVSGPLAGSRIIGSFQTEDRYLVLTFNSVIIDGIAHQTQALALNPDSLTPGMATDVNRRYFQRVVLPAAAAFIQGWGSAVAQASEDTTVSDGVVVTTQSDLSTRQELFAGFESATSTVSQIINEEAGRMEPMIKVRSGTPLGLFFTQPVLAQNR